jgi:hypothetical protein
MPILVVLRQYPKQVLLAMGARVAENGSFYIYSVFSLTYATQYAGINRNVVLNAILLAAAVRRRGHSLLRRVVRSHRPSAGVLVRRDDDRGAGVSVFLDDWNGKHAHGGAGHAGGVPAVPRADVRAASRVPVGAFRRARALQRRVAGLQLASVVAGAPAPLIATALMAKQGRDAVALYVLGMAVVTMLSVYAAAETLRLNFDSE